MYVAEKFIRELNLIPRNGKGFYDQRLLNGLIARIRHSAVRSEFPFGRDSIDPSEEFAFEDGSSLHVGNPRQAAFYFVASVTKGAE